MNKYLLKPALLLAFLVCIASCRRGAELPADTLFTLVPAEHSGIDFANNVQYTEELNCYTFRNFYNGGGVGLGDFNNDGLLDIFFCGNMVSNRLYLNKGNFQFEDVTERAGLGSEGVWTSGVAIADVNGDGWLDIYVCKSGPPGGPKRHNELFINNKDLTFTEKSKEYGLHDEGLSVHAAFFDFDGDGDLDLYLLNNSLRSVGGYDLIPGQRNIPDPQGGNKLYRNDTRNNGEPYFTDVTSPTNIFSSNIGFGLGVAIGDINQDGRQDMFVSNDFFERDYLYLNRHDGYFEEALEDCIRETSMGSMGADIADLNNDGWPDIFVTEMLPEDDRRIKTKTKFENWDLYQQEVKNGYYHQFTRNVLQLNLGAATGWEASYLEISRNFFPEGYSKVGIHFTEISRLAGVHATDWSWGALIFDMDNDGWKDIFVANGIGKDLTDQDYVNFYSDPDNVRAVLQKEGKAITKMVDDMPSEKIPNCAFQNQLYQDAFPKTRKHTEQELDSFDIYRRVMNMNRSPQMKVPTFQNKAAEWGLAQPSFSNGSAYGDLDNDGDLDLVVNNQGMAPFLYRNNADTLLKNNRFLNLKILGEGKNTQAIGAKATILHDGKIFYQEIAPMRGFQSTVDSRLHFGLGDIEKIDTLVVVWPAHAGAIVMTDVPTNQFLTLKPENQDDLEFYRSWRAQNWLFQDHAEELDKPFKKPSPAFSIPFRHVENDFNCFNRDRLLFQMLSASGPPMCKADVNGDGLEDFFIGGAKDSPGALFVQRPDGSFTPTNTALFVADTISEDTDCLFFDANGDGWPDLYVASGGNEFPSSSSALLDRLYLNDGKGNFTKTSQPPLPKFESTATVTAADFDGDGHADLFVGVRLRPFLYGVPCSGYLLRNDGKGNFTDLTASLAPGLKNLGMITAAAWFDADGDGDPDLAIVGEYMPLTIFLNENGRLAPHPSPLPYPSGWWNCLTVADLNGDGHPDLIAGNHGLNSRFKASPEKPVTMWVNDFDQNGSAEQVITIHYGDRAYPLALRNDMVAQMPFLKKKYLYFRDYANQTITDIFTPQQLERAVKLEANSFETAVFINDGKGRFDLRPLPLAAQFAPVHAIAAADFDGDGMTDLLLGGNFYRSKPEVGIYDGSYGWYLKGDGHGGFTAQPPSQSGFFVKGEIRRFILLENRKENLVLVGKNNDSLEVFSWKKREAR